MWLCRYKLFVPYRVAWLSVVFYRQKLLPTETCAAVFVHCADKIHFRMYRQQQSRTYTRRATNCIRYKHKTRHKPAAQTSGTSQWHKERYKKIERHVNIACTLCHCGTSTAGGGGIKRTLVSYDTLIQKIFVNFTEKFLTIFCLLM